MKMNKLLGGAAVAALLAGGAYAQVASLDAGSDFGGQTVASEADGELSGDVVINFALDGVFANMGAGGDVTATITLSNATFDSTVSTTAWTAATDPDCDFGAPTLGGGAGGTSVTFESQAQPNLCTIAGDADDGFLTLPIVVTGNGTDVEVNVTFAATADAGSFKTINEDLTLMDFEQGLSFTFTAGAAGSGLFDADGDDLTGDGKIGTIGGALNAKVDDVDAAGTALTAANQIAASGSLVVTFPEGADGIGSVTAVNACTQGTAANDNVFTCALTGANLNTIEGTDQNIVITDDSDTDTVIVPQVPTATLTLVGVTDFTPVDPAGKGLQEIEVDDGLEETIINNSNFSWVRIGSGGTESNFRAQFGSAEEAEAVDEVRVTVAEGNGVDAQTITLLPSPTTSVGFKVQGATITFNSRGLGAAAGETGNADITGIELLHDEVALDTLDADDVPVLRQLISQAGSAVATPGLGSDN